MLASVVKSAISRVRQCFAGTFDIQPFRKEIEDASILQSYSGNLFKLDSIIGMGGLGVVYRATRIADGKTVALKIASLDNAPDVHELVAREAELMSRLDHPNVVKLVDNGVTAEGDPFIAMEILEGQTLEQVLSTETALDLPRVAKICLQVAEAVQHAHDRGVIHRDIKPGNIMLVERDGVETAVIYDFGISLIVGEDGSAFDDSSSGSLLYASPEQLSDKSCSYHTDVYQLALVMFEALTGRLPFEVSMAGAINYRRSGPLLLSDEELGDLKLHGGVRKLLEEALERDPAQRTSTMLNFIEGLNSALTQMGSWNLCTSAA